MKPMTSHDPVDYLCIGHCCHDKVGDEYILGGTASYASLVAHKLNIQSGIITSVGPDFLFEGVFQDASIPFYNLPAKETTVFENIYTESGRMQHLLARADIIRLDSIPLPFNMPSIIHLCSIAKEIDFPILRHFENVLVGGTIQGCLRRWDEKGLVYPAEMDWSLLQQVDIVILSEDDIRDREYFLDSIIANTPQVVLTKAENGATVFTNGKQHFFPSFPVEQVDATGAGDVFTTAYLIEYKRKQDIASACIFAHCAASFIVEGVGINNMPSLSQINERIVNYRLGL